MKKNSYILITTEAMDKLDVGESFSKKNFILKHWGEYDFWIDRSFSVLFVGVKKKISNKQFRTIKGHVTSIK
jgi:hypothetical protein